MSVVEWVGFMIALLVLTLSVMRRIFEERRRREHPGEYEKRRQEEKRAYRELLKSMGLEEEEEEEPKPEPAVVIEPACGVRRTQRSPIDRVRRPSPRVPPTTAHRRLSDDFKFRAALDQRRKISTVENRHIGTRVHPRFEKEYGERIVSKELLPSKAILRKVRATPVRQVVARLPSRGALVIAHEIISPPKALR